MTTLRKCFGFAALFLSLSASAEYLPSPLHFMGAFESGETSSTSCDFVFSHRDYRVSHYLVGANRRTSVVHFESLEKTGFFHPLTLVGLLGYDNQFRVEHKIPKGGFDYQIVAEGIVSSQLIAMTVKVTQYVPGSDVITCEGQGDFSAFH